VSVIKVAQRCRRAARFDPRGLKTLPQDRAPTAAEWRRLSSKWKAELDERIARLVTASRPAGRMHRLRLPFHAQLLAAQSVGWLSAQGPGPRLLD
jgi:MerR family redox-sensitive transcriptional activator SoxR